jgi:alkaline phosphatase
MMKLMTICSFTAGAVAVVLSSLGATAVAAPTISRLTPPSELFASGNPNPPYIARFAPGQRFDLQATVSPDAGQSITDWSFAVDAVTLIPLAGTTSSVTTGLTSTLRTGVLTPAGTAVVSLRSYSNLTPGVHTLTVMAKQTDGTTSTSSGNFEVVPITSVSRKVKNVIIMLGDGMGASHRTAARIVLNGYAQGKAKQKLAMDTFPNTAMIMTASLNSIVTDSAPGMQNYVTGNKANNNQEGVWPDDTTAAFDNPRVEYVAEYLARTQGKTLGIVTTADVFDATPASMTIHTQARGNGTGIVDQYLDEASKTSNLIVLMGGGRKWFLPSGTTGSARAASSDYILPSDIMNGWSLPASAVGAIDPGRNLINDFTGAGWTYVSDNPSLTGAGTPNKLLGLFSFSNMNIALDKINGRRGTSTVVNDYGFPNQPMLDDMTQKALDVLDANSPNGFVLMVEGASIDKQAHLMDSSRWIGDTIEFDKSIAKAQNYAATHPDTLVIVTADHECSGAVIIGASIVTDATLQSKIALGGVTNVRDAVVGNYDAAQFPKYTLAGDGYPTTYDPDFKLLIGYGANADRYEDWRTSDKPIHDTQQPLDSASPLSGYPCTNSYDSSCSAATPPGARPQRFADGKYFITGQVAGDQAVHTGGDIPLSAYGRGSSLFAGTIDNTDVFFLIMQAAIGGAR